MKKGNVSVRTNALVAKVRFEGRKAVGVDYIDGNGKTVSINARLGVVLHDDTFVRSLRADGMTIGIIEHTMHAMLRIADRFVVLDHGAVLASGPPRQVVEDRTVIEAYLGKAVPA